MEGGKHADWVGVTIMYFADLRDLNNAGGIDLWRTFGDEFKITTDPSCDAKGVPRTSLDPWYFQIPCKYGTIWVWGSQELAIDIDYHDQIANKVRAVPGVWLAHDGDREKTFVFDVSLFRQIAAIVLPRKRRKWTSAQKEALVERGRRFRY